MNVKLVRYPDDNGWAWVRRCALETVGKTSESVPGSEWRHKILEARHSPIRELIYSFEITDIPYFVHVQLVRHHVGINFFVKSQRNDRQSEYDRREARQDAPINMIVSLNAEALMNLANKRLCHLASNETQDLVYDMCHEALQVTPEFEGLLVPACQYNGGVCHEMKPCWRKQ